VRATQTASHPRRDPPSVWYGGLDVRLLPVTVCKCRTSPSLPSPVDQGLRSCISLRITRVIPIAPASLRWPELAHYSLQLVCGAVRRFREKALLFEGMHGLVFRRSIHYWQDQPGTLVERGGPFLAPPLLPSPLGAESRERKEAQVLIYPRRGGQKDPLSCLGASPTTTLGSPPEAQALFIATPSVPHPPLS
jgi:hypothetical protein